MPQWPEQESRRQDKVQHGRFPDSDE